MQQFTVLCLHQGVWECLGTEISTQPLGLKMKAMPGCVASLHFKAEGIRYGTDKKLNRFMAKFSNMFTRIPIVFFMTSNNRTKKDS
jgi:hypothetical protein